MSSLASEQPPHPASLTVGWPPAVPRSLYPTPSAHSPQPAALGSLSSGSFCPRAQAALSGSFHLLAPGFLCVSTSVLLLRDKHLVLQCWCLCNQFLDKPISFVIPLNFICKLFFHPDENSGRLVTFYQTCLVTFAFIPRLTFLFWQSLVQSTDLVTPVQPGLNAQTLKLISSLEPALTRAWQGRGVGVGCQLAGLEAGCLTIFELVLDSCSLISDPFRLGCRDWPMKGRDLSLLGGGGAIVICSWCPGTADAPELALSSWTLL